MLDIIYGAIDEAKSELIELSAQIHANPELAFNEYKAAKNIIALLKKHGFQIEEKAGNLDTAFRATLCGNGEGPAIAILAEYDALPEMGHACGHNLIAATSVGAAIGLSKVMEKLPGKLLLIGTPAEEIGGGKILLLERGAFDDVDFSLMSHPGTENQIGGTGLAITDVTIEFFGKPAHSSAPEKGINALSAVLHTFYLIDSMRAAMPLKANINGIINNGGTAANIIPEYAKCTFSVRGATIGDLQKILEMVKTAIRTAELATGAKAKVDIDVLYAERYENMAIAEVFKKFMEEQGEKVEYPDPTAKVGSSDIGNVMIKMPAIHPGIKICGEEVAGHTLEFKDAALSEQGNEAMIKGAKALAATGYELFTNSSLRQEALAEHKEKVPTYDNTSIEPF